MIQGSIKKKSQLKAQIIASDRPRTDVAFSLLASLWLLDTKEHSHLASVAQKGAKEGSSRRYVERLQSVFMLTFIATVLNFIVKLRHQEYADTPKRGAQ